MNVAVIGADIESVHAIQIAHKLGHKVVAVDVDSHSAGSAMADVALHIDISHEDEVIEALKDRDIDLVLPVPIGRHLLTVGAVNDALGLPGVSRESAVLCTDKYAFHNRLRGVRLRSGHCYLVNADQPIDPDTVEYPAVFKPRYGSHGRSVHYLRSADELDALQADIWSDSDDKSHMSDEELKRLDAGEFANHVKKAMEDHQKQASSEDDPEDDYIVEEALPGVEYAVDGVVEGCNFEVILIRRKTLTDPPARQATAYTVVMPGEDGRAGELIRDYMNRVCETMGLKECMLHADVCIMGHTINAIEISASPAGRHVYDELVPMSSGMDPTEQFLRYMSGDAHNFSPLNMKRMALRYFDMEHAFVHGIPDEVAACGALPEGVRLRKWECDMKLLDYLGSINDEQSILNRGYYIIEGRSDKMLEEAARQIRGSFDLK